MIRFQEFETVKDARAYQKIHGGRLSIKSKNFKRDYLFWNKTNLYGKCVLCSDLDYTKYNCVLVWIGA